MAKQDFLNVLREARAWSLGGGDDIVRRIEEGRGRTFPSLEIDRSLDTLRREDIASAISSLRSWVEDAEKVADIARMERGDPGGASFSDLRDGLDAIGFERRDPFAGAAPLLDGIRRDPGLDFDDPEADDPEAEAESPYMEGIRLPRPM